MHHLLLQPSDNNNNIKGNYQVLKLIQGKERYIKETTAHVQMHWKITICVSL